MRARGALPLLKCCAGPPGNNGVAALQCCPGRKYCKRGRWLALLQSCRMTLHQPCLPLLQCFVKTVNYQHMMPTRYALDVDLKNVVTSESLENSSKRTSARKVRTFVVSLCMGVPVSQSPLAE